MIAEYGNLLRCEEERALNPIERASPKQKQQCGIPPKTKFVSLLETQTYGFHRCTYITLYKKMYKNKIEYYIQFYDEETIQSMKRKMRCRRKCDFYDDDYSEHTYISLYNLHILTMHSKVDDDFARMVYLLIVSKYKTMDSIKTELEPNKEYILVTARQLVEKCPFIMENKDILTSIISYII